MKISRRKGRDLKVVKTKPEAWANYATSSFIYKKRPLTDAEREAIERVSQKDAAK